MTQRSKTVLLTKTRLQLYLYSKWTKLIRLLDFIAMNYAHCDMDRVIQVRFSTSFLRTQELFTGYQKTSIRVSDCTEHDFVLKSNKFFLWSTVTVLNFFLQRPSLNVFRHSYRAEKGLSRGVGLVVRNRTEKEISTLQKLLQNLFSLLA